MYLLILEDNTLLQTSEISDDLRQQVSDGTLSIVEATTVNGRKLFREFSTEWLQDEEDEEDDGQWDDDWTAVKEAS